MTNFGLTRNGFTAPTYQENLDSVEDDFRSKFGNDIVLTSNSNFGILARVIAWRETTMIQELQRTYYSSFYSTATESALDRLGANIGLTRKVAMPATAEIEITTDGEYLVQAGEQFETEDGIIFDLLSDVVTKQQDDGTWKGTGTVEAEETGSITNVEAGKINTISNPDDNVLEVTNPEKAGGGQDDESDEEYRQRLIEDNGARPGPTENGIKSALRALPGVRQVNIVDNDKADTDQYGNPPYSVHIYVLGGNAQEIAKTIMDHQAIGITLTGKQHIEVADKTGEKKTVNFDFAEDKPIYVHVEVETNGAYNSENGSNLIKASVAQYINSLEMGQTIHITKMYKSIYSIQGIENATVTIGTAKEAVSSTDIKLDKFEAPSCDIDNVEVTTDGVHN